MKKIWLVFICIIVAGCSQFSDSRLVQLPSSNQNPQVTLIDLRPESEKIRTDYSGEISVADDRQFFPNKMDYLASELSRRANLFGAKVEVISFIHLLDTRASAKPAQAIGVGSLVAGPIGAAIGSAVGNEATPNNQDKISCNLKIRFEDTEFTSQDTEGFTLGTIMAIEWEKQQLREAAAKVTQKCVNDIVQQIVVSKKERN